MGRVFATEKASADSPVPPMTTTSSAARTMPSTRETIVPDAISALARPRLWPRWLSGPPPVGGVAGGAGGCAALGV
ncbi:hypothetical protein GCM10028781_10830 [Nostocoides australiense]